MAGLAEIDVNPRSQGLIIAEDRRGILSYLIHENRQRSNSHGRHRDRRRTGHSPGRPLTDGRYSSFTRSG
jgi:hypothetical protein